VSMNWNDIERLRVEGFGEARRGYDKREVDKFLDALAEWLSTDAAKDLGGMAVKRKLELAGRSTAQILLTTEHEAEQMRLQTDEECKKLRSEAEAAALASRQGADEYAQKVRGKADQDARSTRDAANAEAKQTIEEGERRRAQVEAVIGDLDARRKHTLREMESLLNELASAIDKHGTDPQPAQRNGGKAGKKAPAKKEEPETAGKS
jgi:cell division septum initiation protein DivIVA